MYRDFVDSETNVRKRPNKNYWQRNWKLLVFFWRVGEMHRDFRRRQLVQDQLFQRKWDTCVLTEQQNELDSGQIHELSE